MMVQLNISLVSFITSEKKVNDMRRKFLHQWVVLDFNSSIRKAQIIDIEFAEGIGPRFLLETAIGNRFWLSRKELRDHEVSR